MWLSHFFVKYWRFATLLWLALLFTGAITYTSLIKREGFPSIQFPLTVVSGTYFVNDSNQVDTLVAQPLSNALNNLEGIERVDLSAGPNFFTVIAQFEADTNPQSGTEQLRAAIEQSNLPSEVQLEYTTIDPAAFLNRYDLLLSVYSTDSTTTAGELQETAQRVADELETDNSVVLAEPVTLVSDAVDPASGEMIARQTAFSRIGLPANGALEFYPAITIGIDRDTEKYDVIAFSELINEKIVAFDMAQYGEQYRLAVGADFAESITTQITSLESNLLSGLVAVAIVSFLLITWRASIITGLFMLTVMAAVVFVLYVVGYTLNTITLFALVLSLGLFVDDATIVVEALDASRRKKKKTAEIVKEAVGKVGAASFAGTMTTVLVFLPLVFISGILGEFIRLMPVTIILALLSSLVLSLTVIPVLSKFILLKKVDESWLTRRNPIPQLEAYTATKISNLTALLATRKQLGRTIGVGMVALSIVFVLFAGTFAQKLTFNVFPSSKDSDQIGFQITYPPAYTLTQAEDVVDKINSIVARELGAEVKRVTYGSFAQPNERAADALIELRSFTEREPKSPQLMERLQTAVEAELDPSISFRVVQYDAGPPVEEFPFKVQVFSEDDAMARQLAREIEEYLTGATIERVNGTTAQVTKVQIANQQTIERRDGKRYVQVEAAFDADDTTALVTAAQSYVEEKFDAAFLEQRGFAASDLGFDFGQESENEDSFSSLGVIFPVALLMMYVLLTVQFRSLLQPILIFMAIPFSLLGVFAGLYFTDNSLSFFSMIGLIGLIGIAVNNTILLTDYANQERRTGASAVDAISQATKKRFRPLVTTTLTTVVALLPLALSDPFWESLAFTIIFGLLSSTLLVILAFPYYYLGAEWLRNKAATIAKKTFRKLKK